MTNHDATLTTTTPDGASFERPVPLGIAAVWLLLQRYEMALFPVGNGTWDVLTGYASGLEVRVFEARQVPWRQVPQAIQALAAQCEAAAREGEA